MAGYVEVAEAVAERAQPVLLGWRVLWYKPVPPPAPGLYVCPDPATYVSYQATLSAYARWPLRLELYVTANDKKAAYRKLSELTDPRGPLISTLLDEDIRDSLWDLCGQDIAVTDGKKWKMRGGRSPYLTADIGLVCGVH